MLGGVGMGVLVASFFFWRKGVWGWGGGGGRACNLYYCLKGWGGSRGEWMRGVFLSSSLSLFII